ncbi:homeobox even-skipped homolog protein 2-like [Vespa mandarinia]|uniref:homeobox even-skipped homolog protein 2-like n=1 Tax=Vespa mandarinia TaxID=7446 RepID=UPI00162139F4|nr:homeobox even-skipped homolog protein 2-like [Vespa mandarinia]
MDPAPCSAVKAMRCPRAKYRRNVSGPKSTLLRRTVVASLGAVTVAAAAAAASAASAHDGGGCVLLLFCRGAFDPSNRASSLRQCRGGVCPTSSAPLGSSSSGGGGSGGGGDDGSSGDGSGGGGGGDDGSGARGRRRASASARTRAPFASFTSSCPITYRISTLSSVQNEGGQ